MRDEGLSGASGQLYGAAGLVYICLDWVVYGRSWSPSRVLAKVYLSWGCDCPLTGDV